MIKVTPILGHIAVSGAELVEAKPANNNTRWIFDVEGSLKPEEKLVVQLLDPRSKRPLNPDVVASSLLPLSPTFYDARPFVDPLNETESGTLAFRHGAAVSLKEAMQDGLELTVCRYRVQVDIMHSATR